MKKKLLTLSVIAATTAAITSWNSHAAEGKGATIKDVMKGQFKGETSNFKKATKGELDKAAVAKLLADCKELCTQKPAKGDEASWKEKTGALVSALEALDKGETDAAAKVEKAGNCKACHDVHKGGKGPGGPKPQ